MSTSQKLLLSLANSLEAIDHPALIQAEEDGVLEPVAEILVSAAMTLRKVAEDLALIEPVADPITVEQLDEMAAVATEFANSGDPLLAKQAAVLDDLLCIFADNSELFATAQKAKDNRLEELKKNYRDTLERQKENDGIKEAEKALAKSPATKEYRTMEAPLSTRSCVDHPGASLVRVGEHQYQCHVDGKIYDYEAGFTTETGTKVPGGNVNGQSQYGVDPTFTTLNDSRSDRMGYNNQYKWLAQ